MAPKHKIKPQNIHFLIDHIDPLGQGVYKHEENIYFIPKTLPGESGQARILKKKKNIHFCEVVKIDQKSPARIEPVCPHFENCPSCHFLHTNYQKEIAFKEKSFLRMLAPLGVKKIETLSAPSRLGYRNRIQLHYRRKAQKLGYIQSRVDRIFEVPECKIMRPELKPEFARIYSDWPKVARKRQGHVEIYSPDGEQVQTTWDSKYAEGGFTQVNREMNERLLEYLAEILKDLPSDRVLDLFGGNGNLSQSLKNSASELYHVDIYPEGKGDNFLSLNLMEESSLETLKNRSASTGYDLFLVDPPRAGFKLLPEWIEEFQPKNLVYVSCHPQTMVRDLLSIKRPIKIERAALLDLFPSTHHFEAICLVYFPEAHSQ